MSRHKRRPRGQGRPPDGQLRMGVCPACKRPCKTVGGRLERHTVIWPVSPAATPSVGAAAVQRRCPGSGGVPRRIENVELPDA